MPAQPVCGSDDYHDHGTTRDDDYDDHDHHDYGAAGDDDHHRDNDHHHDNYDHHDNAPVWELR